MRYLITAVLLSLSASVWAQTKIQGTVTGANKKPLQGVSITLNDSYDGATSDSLGNFAFTTHESGNKEISATASGYRPFTQSVDLHGETISLVITLKEAQTELKAVIISAGAFEAGDQKKATALSSLDIVTTASSNGDITNALKTLPGSQQVGESEGLFVRGGTAEETKFFIDGSLVNNFFYTSEPGQATRGRFNPFLFSGTVFSSGGYSALYGEALSSVVIMESLDLPEKTSASFGLSYLAANGGFQKLGKNKKTSWGATYAFANLDLVYGLIKQKFDYFVVPKIHNMDLNYRIKTRGGMIKYYGMLGITHVGYRNADIDSPSLSNAFELRNLNMYHNLSWRESLGSGWKFRLSTSYTYNRDQVDMELQENKQKLIISADPLYASKNFNLDNKANYLNGKLVFEKRIAGLNMLRFGGEMNQSIENTKYAQNSSAHQSFKLKEMIGAAFAETDLYVTNDLAAKIGVRAEHSYQLARWNIAPRISLAYRFADLSQVSVAFGNFYQTPESKYMPAPHSLLFSKATHYILQYQKITNQRTLRVETFYKKYNDLLKTSYEYGRFTALDNRGFGDAKGVELFWRDKRTIRNFDYWISYSYLDTKRDFLNYPHAMQPSFAAKHTASLVMKKFVLPIKTGFNASYTFASGRPYYNLQPDGNTFKIVESGYAKSYNDLSFSINYVPSVGKTNAKSFSVFVLSVSNVLGADNVYSYNFSANGERRVAVTPPAKRFYYLGWFISLGIDRTEDAINNHL